MLEYEPIPGDHPWCIAKRYNVLPEAALENGEELALTNSSPSNFSADIDISTAWREVSMAMPVSVFVQSPDSEIWKVPALAAPKKKDSLLPVDPQPFHCPPAVVVRLKSTTTRVVVLGTMPVLMYCVPDEAMYFTSV